MNGTIGTIASAGWSPPRMRPTHESTPGPSRYAQKLLTRYRRSSHASAIARASQSISSSGATGPLG